MQSSSMGLITTSFYRPHHLSEGDLVTMSLPAHGWPKWWRVLTFRSPVVDVTYKVTQVHCSN